MHISSQKPSVVGRSAYRLYLIMVSVILLSIVTEGVLIGPSLFADTHWGRAVHGDLGAALLLLTLLLPVVGGLLHLPRRIILLSLALFALTLIQEISADRGRSIPVFAALHPANALLMAGLTVVLLTQGWHLLREKSDEAKIERPSSAS